MSEPNNEGIVLQPLDPVDINGRLAELQELLQAVTGRCSGLRGQLALKERELAQLRQQVASYKAKEEEASKEPPAKPNGSKHKEATH